jgi:hypothetical protein
MNDLLALWMTNWFPDRLFADWMTCLIEWPYQRLNYWFTVWLYLTECLPDWLNDLISDWIIDSRSDCIWLNVCQTDRMTLSATELLAHGLTVFDWMTAWLIEWPYQRLNCWFMIWMCDDWMTAGLNDLISDWIIDARSDCIWLNVCLTDWMTSSATELLVHGLTVFDWMSAWLIEWPYQRLNYWFTVWLYLTEWPPDWLNELTSDWIVGSRSDCLLTEWLPGWLNELTNWMSGLQTSCLLTKWQPGWLNCRLTDSERLTTYGPTPCWVNDRLTDRLNDWQTEWQGCWMNDYKWLLISQKLTPTLPFKFLWNRVWPHWGPWYEDCNHS